MRIVFKRSGFTLIEILLVIVVLSVMIGLAVPNLGGSFKSIVLKKTADDIAFSMRWAQSRAVEKQHKVVLVYDSAAGRYQVKDVVGSDEESVTETISHSFGRPVNIDKSLTIDWPNSEVYFYSDGMIDPVRIYVSSNSQTVTVTTQEQEGLVYVFDERFP